MTDVCLPLSPAMLSPTPRLTPRVALKPLPAGLPPSVPAKAILSTPERMGMPKPSAPHSGAPLHGRAAIVVRCLYRVVASCSDG